MLDRSLLRLHNNNREARRLTVPKCQGISLCLPSAVKIFLLRHGKPCAARQEHVGLWHGAVPGGAEASGLGWLPVGMGWAAAAGSEGTGQPPTGLMGDAEAHRVVGETWGRRKH